VGVVPYSPGSRTATDITLFLLGGLVGAVVGLALAPKAGVELRSDVRQRAMNLFDQVKNKAEDVERASA
jgi:gas vesicle protein